MLERRKSSTAIGPWTRSRPRREGRGRDGGAVVAEDGEDEPDVVGLAVVEEIGVVGFARGERRHQLQHLVLVDRAVAVGGPVVVVGLLAASEALGAALHNDLEVAAFHLRPELAEARDAFLAAGALGAIVSGSGPTVVGLARDADDGELMRRADAAATRRSPSGP